MQRTRDAAVEISRLGKPGFDPWKEFRENEETRQFFQKQTEEAQLSYVNQAWKKTKKVASDAKNWVAGKVC